MTDTIKLLKKAAKLLEEEGLIAKVNAAFAGQGGDGGCNAMIREAEVFLAGLEQRTPRGWEEHLIEAQRQMKLEVAKSDPEWAEYERLKNKFETKERAGDEY